MLTSNVKREQRLWGVGSRMKKRWLPGSPIGIVSCFQWVMSAAYRILLLKMCVWWGGCHLGHLFSFYMWFVLLLLTAVWRTARCMKSSKWIKKCLISQEPLHDVLLFHSGGSLADFMLCQWNKAHIESEVAESISLAQTSYQQGEIYGISSTIALINHPNLIWMNTSSDWAFITWS